MGSSILWSDYAATVPGVAIVAALTAVLPGFAMQSVAASVDENGQNNVDDSDVDNVDNGAVGNNNGQN